MKSLYPLPDKYRYFTIFASELKPVSKDKKEEYVSVASKTNAINNLKNLLPNIDLETNIDLLPFSAEAFIINKINENGDGVKNKEGLILADSLKLKYCDIEHNKTHLIGTILDTSFARKGSDEPLTREEAENLDEPFAVVVSGIIWKLVNESIANLIEASSDPDSDKYGKIRLSWEAAFENYNLILLEKNDKNIKNGRMITDAKKIEELEQHLKSMGGNGKTKDGLTIARVITGEPLGIGVGFTENWAADVGPVVTADSSVNLKIKNDSNSNLDTEIKENMQAKKLLTEWIQKYGTKKNKELTEADLDKHVQEIFAGKGIMGQEDNLKKENLNLNPGYVNCEASTSEHYINKCSCGNTISTCRCNGSNKKINTVENGCNECQAKLKNSFDTGFPVNKPAENYNILPPATASQSNQANTNLELLNKIVKNTNVDNNLCVKDNNENIHMKLNSIKDITDENLKQCQASDISTLIESKTEEIAKEWSTKTKSQEELTKKAEEALANTEKTLNDVQNKLNALVQAQAAKEMEEKFGLRMSAWENDYDLDGDEKEVIASEIKTLDDASYETYAAKMKKLMKSKKKGSNDKVNKSTGNQGSGEVNEKDGNKKGHESLTKEPALNTKASVNQENSTENTLENAIENGKKDSEIPNTITGEPSLKERMNASFNKDNWFVDARRVSRMKK